MELPSHLRAGRDAEERAHQYLRRHGLHLIERNFRCRGGEIDLIMRDGDTLVFVEVRFRRDDRFGDGADSVGHRKQARLICAAQTYLVRTDGKRPCRFDVVAITGKHLQWFRNAFET